MLFPICDHQVANILDQKSQIRKVSESRLKWFGYGRYCKMVYQIGHFNPFMWERRDTKISRCTGDRIPFQRSQNLQCTETAKEWRFLGGSPGLVVRGGDSWSRGRGLESKHCILDGHFSHSLQRLNCLFEKTEINKKETVDGPLKMAFLVKFSNGATHFG